MNTAYLTLANLMRPGSWDGSGKAQTTIQAIASLNIPGASGGAASAAFKRKDNGTNASTVSELKAADVAETIDVLISQSSMFTLLTSWLSSIVSADRGADGFKEREQVAKTLAEVYNATDLISIISALSNIKEPVNDTGNAYSLNKCWTQWNTTLNPKTFKSTFCGHVLVGNGVKNTVAEIEAQGIPGLEALELVYPQGISYDTSDFDLKDVLDFLNIGVASGGKAINGKGIVANLYEMLTDYQLLTSVPRLLSLYDDLLMVSDRPQSDDQSFDRVVKASERIRDIIAVRMFYALQGWVTILQVALKPFTSPGVIDHFETKYPALAAEMSTKDIFGFINSLPIGDNVAALLKDYPLYTDMNVKGIGYPVLEMSGGTANPERTLFNMLNVLHRASRRLYALTKQKDIWEIYNKGAQIVGSASLSFKSINLKDDGFPVSNCQLGVFAGDQVRTIDDFSHTMVFDHGLNMYNASALSLYRWSDRMTDFAPEPLCYGKINHMQYWKDMMTRLSNWSKTGDGVISGSQFALSHVVCVPIKRHVRDYDFIKLAIEPGYVKIGTASALPYSASQYIPIRSAVTTRTAEKSTFGEYVTDIDKMGLPINIVDAHSPDKAPPIDKTLLAQYLNTTPSQLDKAKDHVPVFSRFLQAKDSSKLACDAIVVDQIFADTITAMYYVPARFTNPNIHLVVQNSNFASEIGPESTTVTKVIKVGAVRLIAAQRIQDVLHVPNARLVGSTLFFDGQYGYQSKDDQFIVLT
jgi:hypothetical protein